MARSSVSAGTSGLPDGDDTWGDEYEQDVEGNGRKRRRLELTDLPSPLNFLRVTSDLATEASGGCPSACHRFCGLYRAVPLDRQVLVSLGPASHDMSRTHLRPPSTKDPSHAQTDDNVRQGINARPGDSS